MSELDLEEYHISKLTEENLINFCELNNIK